MFHTGSNYRLSAQNILGGVKALRITSFVTFSKLFNLSEAGFPPAKYGYSDM